TPGRLHAHVLAQAAGQLRDQGGQHVGRAAVAGPLRRRRRAGADRPRPRVRALRPDDRDAGARPGARPAPVRGRPRPQGPPGGGAGATGRAAANSWISGLVIDGASSASPPATTRIPAASCSGGTSLSRKPLAPARSAS